MSLPILAFNYWIHLIATAIWIGGLLMLIAVIWPGLQQNENAASLLEAVERRYRPLGNVSLALLLVTGMIQMGGDSHYEGFLAINSLWAQALLIKHLLIGGVILLTAFAQIQILPEIDRLRLLAAKDPAAGEQQIASYRRRIHRLTLVNLVLGILILLFTAVMTAI